MRFYLVTLGCKVNQYESQVILERWTYFGHDPVASPEQAEVIVVHSCAVTAKAVADLRKAVAALNRSAPQAAIVLSGCAAQTFSAELHSLPGVARIAGRKERNRLLRGPDALLGPRAEEPSPDSASDQDEGLFAGISDFRRARAQLKVQDGCSHGCTYCIVPLARGPERSRPPEEIVAEVGRLLETGFREVSLIGINLRLYGQNLHPRLDFWDLVQLLEQTYASKWAGRARFRLSSLEPAMLGKKALDVLSDSRLLCPHLHLSLQSASPAVLAAMGRNHYHPGAILEFCDELSRRLPLYALGVDLLTGFPGERDIHFRETLDFSAQLPLTYAHVFPFSPRPGTLAANLGGQVPDTIRRQRAKLLRTIAETKRLQFWEALAQRKEVMMVVERMRQHRAQTLEDRGQPSPVKAVHQSKGTAQSAGMYTIQGKCEYYVPCRVNAESNELRVRQLWRIRPIGINSQGLECVRAEASPIQAEL